MHEANRKWWKYCSETYLASFNDCSVLEVGSYDINGSIRDYFKNCLYIGIDWRDGPCVDIVCFAHDIKFEKPFDTIVSASTLEHDPYWEASLKAMCTSLKPNGLMFLSWAGPEYTAHELHNASDGKYHPRTMGEIIDSLIENGMKIMKQETEKQFCGGADSYLMLIAKKSEWRGI